MTLELATALHALDDTEVQLEVARANELLPDLRRIGVPVSIASLRPTLRCPRLSLLRVVPGPWSIGGRARRQRVDAVVSVMDHPLSGLGALCLRLAKVPLVSVVHDARAHDGERKRLLALSSAATARLSTRVVVLSQFVRAQMIEGGCSAERIDVIPHGPFYDAQPCVDRPDTGSARVLFFGRIVAYKGLDLLLAAWPAVRAVRPDATLHIAGEGALPPNGIDQPGVTVRNEWIADAAVPAIFDAADLVVLPYREASQSGVVTVARSFGVPVLVTRVGGLSEQVLDGVDGLVTEPDLAAIAAAIVRFFDHHEVRAQLRAGRRTGGRTSESWTEIATAFRDSAAKTLPSR